MSTEINKALLVVGPVFPEDPDLRLPMLQEPKPEPWELYSSFLDDLFHWVMVSPWTWGCVFFARLRVNKPCRFFFHLHIHPEHPPCYWAASTLNHLSVSLAPIWIYLWMIIPCPASVFLYLLSLIPCKYLICFPNNGTDPRAHLRPSHFKSMEVRVMTLEVRVAGWGKLWLFLQQKHLCWQRWDLTYLIQGWQAHHWSKG